MKTSTGIIIALVVIVAVLAIIYTPIGQHVPFNIADGKSSISGIMHGAIDPVSPTFIQTARVSCTAIDGTWYDQSNKMGCFNMPAGSFDSTNCNTILYSQLANTCQGIDTAYWTCTTTAVGCYY